MFNFKLRKLMEIWKLASAVWILCNFELFIQFDMSIWRLDSDLGHAG